MSDTPEQLSLPWPVPTDDGEPDPTHKMHQELEVDGAGQAHMLGLSALAYETFQACQSARIDQATFDTLAASIQAVADKTMDELCKLPAPIGVGPEEYTQGESTFLPYYATIIFALLANMSAKALPNGTHADRYAFIGEFVRCYACYGAFHAAKQAGLNDAQIAALGASRLTMQPLHMGAIAQACKVRNELRDAAATAGVDVADYMRTRLQEIIKDGPAPTRPHGRVPGDPDDDPGTMAF